MASMAAALGWSPEVTMWRCWTWCVVWPPMPSQRSSWVARTGISTSRENTQWSHGQAMVGHHKNTTKSNRNLFQDHESGLKYCRLWCLGCAFQKKKTLPRRDLLLTSRQDVVFRFAMEATASYLPVEGLQAQDSTSIYIYDIHTCMSDMKEKLKNLVREKSSVRSFFWARPADICWHLLTASGSFSYWQENKPEVKKCEGWAAECGPEISPPNRRKFPESDVLIEWRTSFAWSCNDVSNLLNSFQKLILTLSHLFFLKLFSPLLRSLHLFSSLLNSCQLFSPCALLRSTVFPLLCSTLLYSTLFYSMLLPLLKSTQRNSTLLSPLDIRLLSYFSASGHANWT